MSTTDQPSTLAATIEMPVSAPSTAGVFDNLDALKLSLDEVGLQGAAEIVARVPVRKPLKQEYFRIRTGNENSFTTIIYEDREMREFYFVTPRMIGMMRSITDLSVVTLMQFMTKQRVHGIFPVKIANDFQASNGWQETAVSAVAAAKRSWVRMQADMALGGYRIFAAQGELEEPKWPEMPFNEILDIAFKDRVIDSESHPVINKLLGRV